MRNAPSRLALLLALTLSCFPLVPALAQTGAAEAGNADGMATIAVVGVSSYDELMADIGYVGGLVGRPQTAQMIDGTIALFTQGKGLVGLDKSRPWGVVLQTDGAQFVPLVCLPIDDLDAILQLLIGFQIQSEDLGGGVYEIANADQILYAKQADDWVYVGQTETSLESAPADPTPVLSALVDEYDLGARVLVQNVPPLFKQMAIGQLRAGLEAGLQQQDGETAEAYATRREMGELQVQQIVDMINDLDEFTLGWSVDSKNKRTYLDMIVSAVEGSKLGKQFTGAETIATKFSGFIKPDASLMFRACMKQDPEALEEQTKQMEDMFTQMKEQLHTQIDEADDLPSDAAREVLKEVTEDLIEAYLATLATGEVDGAFSATLSPTTLSVVGGFFAKETDEVKSALEELDEFAKSEAGDRFPGVQWDAASRGGASLHTLTLPLPAEAAQEARQMFGDELSVVVGIGEEVLYFAAGKDAMQELEAAIDASEASTGPAATPMELVVSLADVMAFAKAVDKSPNAALTAMIADLLAGADSADHVRVTLNTTPTGARYRLELEEGVLKAIGAAAAAAQQAQMQQGGF